MDKSKLLLLMMLLSSAIGYSQINFGVSISGGNGSSNMKYSDIKRGKLISGGVFINYTDADNYIYETGLYYTNRNFRIKNISDEYDLNTSSLKYNLNEIKLPLIIGTKLDRGILFSKVNAVLLAGIYTSYGISGDVEVEESDLTKVNIKDPYQSENTGTYDYYPLKKIDMGSIIKSGFIYKNFSLYIIMESGFINLNQHYDKRFQSDNVYFSIGYNLTR